MLANFKFSGKMLDYLSNLSFAEGRIIFMFRSRMFPTRVNYPDRWSTSLNCTYCSLRDTDEHLFSCWGYLDLVNNIDYSMFHRLDVSMEKLGEYEYVFVCVCVFACVCKWNCVCVCVIFFSE